MSKSADEVWRVFIAIELPANLRRRITQHVDHLREALPDARASWSREDNLHLTLKFLGDIPVTDVEKLGRAAERAASVTTRFEIAIERCGAFPLHDQPRVLWLGIDDASGKLSELQNKLEDECARENFAREPRAFR